MRSLTHLPYRVLGQQVVNANWNGSPLTLQQYDSATMPQTPNGSLILAYVNQATENNQGTLAYTSGGSAPGFLSAPPMTNAPGLLIRNWRANDLGVTNISANRDTPIWIEAFGPGLPGQSCLPLKLGIPLPIATVQCATGVAKPNWCQLVFASNTANLSVVALIGGPQDASGNNAYVVALNASANTGPDGPAPPPGYYATTTANAFTFQFNWGSSNLYVVNMSPVTAAAVVVTLQSL
jgi:hypothetical protein